MYLVKAGESHGKAMVGIVCNVPSGIKLDENFINSLLLSRSKVAGRSERQNFENDKIDLITGVRNSITLGNNIAILIKNKAHDEFKEVMGEFSADCESRKVTALRPGHADLGGLMRTGLSDARNILEGASARNTCLDVACGGISLAMLNMLGINVTAFVRSLNGKTDTNSYTYNDVKNVEGPYFSPDKQFITTMKKELSKCEDEGESIGGTIEIIVSKIKGGFGSYVAEKRVNSLIAQHIMEIQSVKGVYFGEDPFINSKMGSKYNGSIIYEDNNFKMSNSSTGGISGGMTEGGEIKIDVAVKPLPTTKTGSWSCDYITKEKCLSARERSDTTAVFALCTILKCVTATALSEAICERLGCDNMENITKRYNLL